MVGFTCVFACDVAFTLLIVCSLTRSRASRRMLIVDCYLVMNSIIEVAQSIKACSGPKKAQGLQRIFDASEAGHFLYNKFNEEWTPGKVQFVQAQIGVIINCGEEINQYSGRRWAALLGERLLGKNDTDGFLNCGSGFKKTG